MSDAVSALQGKSFDGPVSLREDGLRGMITLRGDLSNDTLRRLCSDLTGVDFPHQGQAQGAGQKGLCWMSPDEVLVLVPHGEVEAALTRIREGLAGQHHLAVNVSDARAVFVIEGPWVREVVAKLAPVDLSPDAFTPGSFRRTHVGQIAAAFWMRDAQSIELICFRSVADYAFNLLKAAIEGGAVGHFKSGA